MELPMTPATTITAAMPVAVAKNVSGLVKRAKWAAGLLLLLGLVAGWEVRESMGEPVLTK
jgi:hypothetical protein